MSDIKLIHGDCLEKMKDISDKSIDMILADLPYGTTACKWDVIIPFEPLWEQYKRIIKDRGAIVLFGSEPFSSVLRCSNLSMYKYDWVWKKSKAGNFIQANFQPIKYHESISIFSTSPASFTKTKQPMFYYPQMWGETKAHNNGQSIQTAVAANRGKFSDSYILKSTNKTGKRFPISVIEYANTGKVHPTQKPVALLEYLVKTYTLEGETVLDNCAGSFSTAIACLNTKRNFIGIEKDAHYFQVGKDRVEKHLLVLDYTPEIIYNQV